MTVARDATRGVATAVAVALLGAPAGLIWAATAAHVTVVAAGGDLRLVHPEGEAAIAADGQFLLVTAVAGLLCGLLAVFLVARAGLAVVLGLAVGGAAAALVAWHAGHLYDADALSHTLRSAHTARSLAVPATLGAKSALVAWPLVSLLVFLVGFALRVHDE